MVKAVWLLRWADNDISIDEVAAFDAVDRRTDARVQGILFGRVIAAKERVPIESLSDSAAVAKVPLLADPSFVVGRVHGHGLETLPHVTGTLHGHGGVAGFAQ